MFLTETRPKEWIQHSLYATSDSRSFHTGQLPVAEWGYELDGVDGGIGPNSWFGQPVSPQPQGTGHLRQFKADLIRCAIKGPLDSGDRQ
jgi:hypothetical protein